MRLSFGEVGSSLLLTGFLLNGLAFAGDTTLRVVRPAHTPAGCMEGARIEVIGSKGKGSTASAKLASGLDFRNDTGKFVTIGNGLYLVGEHHEGTIPEENDIVVGPYFDTGGYTPARPAYSERAIYLGEIGSDGEVTLDPSVSATITQSPAFSLRRLFTGETLKTTIALKASRFGAQIPFVEDSASAMPRNEVEALRQLREELFPFREGRNVERDPEEDSYLGFYLGYHERPRLKDSFPLIRSPIGKKEALELLVNSQRMKDMGWGQGIHNPILAVLETVGPEWSADAKTNSLVRDFLMDWMQKRAFAKGKAEDTVRAEWRRELVETAHQWYRAPDVDAAGRDKLMAVLSQAGENDPLVLAEIDKIHDENSPPRSCERFFQTVR